MCRHVNTCVHVYHKACMIIHAWIDTYEYVHHKVLMIIYASIYMCIYVYICTYVYMALET